MTADAFYMNEDVPIQVRLMFAAEESIAKNGVKGTSLTKCAQRCGATAAAYQYHFAQAFNIERGYDAGNVSTIDYVVDTILRYHMSRIHKYRVAAIQDLESLHGVTLHTIRHDGKVIVKEGVESPLSADELLLVVVVPFIEHILRHKPRSWFARFQLMLHMNEPGVLARYFDLPWGSTNNYVYAFARQHYMGLLDDEKLVEMQVGRILRLIPMCLSMFEQDIYEFRLRPEQVESSINHVISILLQAIEPAATVSAHNLTKRWLPDAEELVAGIAGASARA